MSKNHATDLNFSHNSITLNIKEQGIQNPSVLRDRQLDFEDNSINTERMQCSASCPVHMHCYSSYTANKWKYKIKG